MIGPSVSGSVMPCAGRGDPEVGSIGAGSANPALIIYGDDYCDNDNEDDKLEYELGYSGGVVCIGNRSVHIAFVTQVELVSILIPFHKL